MCGISDNMHSQNGILRVIAAAKIAGVAPFLDATLSLDSKTQSIRSCSNEKPGNMRMNLHASAATSRGIP